MVKCAAVVGENKRASNGPQFDSWSGLSLKNIKTVDFLLLRKCFNGHRFFPIMVNYSYRERADVVVQWLAQSILGPAIRV